MRAVILLFLACPMFLAAQSVNSTYSAGDIPTSLAMFNPTCNGPVTTLSVSLPVGGPWIVTGIDIQYNMLAQSTGWKSHQRSLVYCQNTSTPEPLVYFGTGDVGGIQNYSRSNVSIANGIFVGGTSMIFEMRAWRTSEGMGCNTTYNRINNFTWTITVHYSMYPESGSVGVGTSSPDSSALLDLTSATKGLLPPRMTTDLRLAIEAPATGLVVYDTDVDKIYYYSGSSWVQINPDFSSILRDADNDTKIQVEESVDEDIIRFDVGGMERWKMEDTRLEPKNTGNSLFIGENAGLNDDLSGNGNISIGNNSLYSNDAGTNNVALGHYSLHDNDSGDDNIAIGWNSLLSSEGNQNTAIGNYSLAFGLPTDNNTAVGYRALSYSTGTGNTAIGTYALDSCIGRSYDTAIGYYSLAKDTWTVGTGPNTAVGAYSLRNNTIGFMNAVVGYQSMFSNIDGHKNTAIGYQSLNNNISGSDNVAIGFESGYGSAGADFNGCTFVGALTYPSVGRYNVTMLGSYITNSECTDNNQVLLGNTAITSIRAEVTGITAYSDSRYKTNITEDIKGLDFIKRLRPVSYHVRPIELHKIWGTPDSLYQRIDHSDVENTRFSGFIAQEVEQAAIASNYAFTGIEVPANERQTYALRYTEFIVPLVKAVQELQAEVEQLKTEIELLKEERLDEVK